MQASHIRSLLLATLLGLTISAASNAETIIKFELGATSPDVVFQDGILATSPDGDLESPGDRQTDASFSGFVKAAGIEDIAGDASITLSGITASGAPVVIGETLVNQTTTGGKFSLYNELDQLILEGDLLGGVLSGPLGTTGASTGSLFTVNLGRFTGPTDENDQIFKLLDPESAQLSMSFTNVNDGNGGSGLSIADGLLLNFEADVTANLEAEAKAIEAPEPAGLGLAMIAAFALLGIRRRR